VDTIAPAALLTPEAATELLVREEGGIRRVIRYYIRDHAAEDDVWQEVCLRAVRHIGGLNHPGAARGWVYQVARNAAMDWLRRCDRAVVRLAPTLPEFPDPGESGRGPGDAVLTSERIVAVQKALDALPPSQREAIRLRIEEGLDHVQIAERLGINRQAVEVRLCKGRAALRERLAEILEGDL
jgi:RNA polymerase sigma-70 factor (ECF subfamily)